MKVERLSSRYIEPVISFLSEMGTKLLLKSCDFDESHVNEYTLRQLLFGFQLLLIGVVDADSEMIRAIAFVDISDQDIWVPRLRLSAFYISDILCESKSLILNDICNYVFSTQQQEKMVFEGSGHFSTLLCETGFVREVMFTGVEGPVWSFAKFRR